MPGAGAPKGQLQYLATNDRRYPTELVVYNPERDVFHFIYSQQGKWSQGNTTQETIPANKLSSTHWIWPYLENWKSGKGEYAKLGQGADEIKTGNKINIARAKSHFKQGEKIAAVDKKTGEVIRITGFNQFGGLPASKYDYAYITESKLNEVKINNTPTLDKRKYPIINLNF